MRSATETLIYNRRRRLFNTVWKFRVNNCSKVACLALQEKNNAKTIP